ncbi:MAG TPA: hypothetical protein VEX18_07610, partial [Polyangiaceae bacterium]|nr:hypothetical protein [Polyangiaceae bacterium]
FRRTWRKQMYSFKGLEDRTFPLLEGSGRAEVFTIGDSRIENANDLSGMGLSEPQLPIILLEPLPLPSENDLPLDGAEEFEPGELERPFYDDLCCSQLGEKCGTVDTPSCCGELGCEVGGDGVGTCSDCRPTGATCDSYTGCCAGNECSGGGTCEACQRIGDACEVNADCCMGSYCNYDGRCEGT